MFLHARCGFCRNSKNIKNMISLLGSLHSSVIKQQQVEVSMAKIVVIPKYSESVEWSCFSYQNVSDEDIQRLKRYIEFRKKLNARGYAIIEDYEFDDTLHRHVHAYSNDDESNAIADSFGDSPPVSGLWKRWLKRASAEEVGCYKISYYSDDLKKWADSVVTPPKESVHPELRFIPGLKKAKSFSAPVFDIYTDEGLLDRTLWIQIKGGDIALFSSDVRITAYEMGPSVGASEYREEVRKAEEEYLKGAQTREAEKRKTNRCESPR